MSLPADPPPTGEEPVGDRRPLGVFDSGVGGLTVASALMQRLPDESILYLGDTARLPYGTKSPATVARYTRRNIEFLVERGVKAVVIACNTASAVLLDDVEMPVPVWGVIEPGAEAALAAAGEGPIGILATESTIRSDAYGRAIRRTAPHATVLSQACPLFVPLVEEGWYDDPIAEQVAERYLQPLVDRGVGTLVLGCTHYPLLGPLIARVAERLAGRPITLVDSAQTVARRVSGDLAAAGLSFPATLLGEALPGAVEGAVTKPTHHLCVTDVADRFQRIARELLTHFHTFDERTVDESISLEWVEV